MACGTGRPVMVWVETGLILFAIAAFTIAWSVRGVRWLRARQPDPPPLVTELLDGHVGMFTWMSPNWDSQPDHRVAGDGWVVHGVTADGMQEVHIIVPRAACKAVAATLGDARWDDPDYHGEQPLETP